MSTLDLSKYSKSLSPEDFAAFQQAVNDQNTAFQAVKDFQNTLPQNVRREDGYDAVIATPAYQQFQDAQRRMQEVLDANPKAFGADPRAGKPNVNLYTLYQQDARNPNNIVKYDPAGNRSGKNSFLSKIGGGLANTIGDNPWVLALPMLAAAAPALIGATGLGSAAGTAGTTAAAGAGAGASSGGFLSSLLSTASSLPTTFSNFLGGGTLGSIGAGALKGAALGGLTGGLSGQGVGKGLIYGGLTGGALSGLGSAFSGTPIGDLLGESAAGTATQGAGGAYPKDVLAFTPKDFGSSSSFLPAASSKGILSEIADAIKNPSLADVGKVISATQAIAARPPEGTLSQKDVLNQMNSYKADQAAQTQNFVAGLNSAPQQRMQNPTNNTIDYYNYGSAPEQRFFNDASGSNAAKFAKGGVANKSMKSPLSAVAAGIGGQDDSVPAKLSVGEYVLPADVVSHLGDGNTNAGAKKLDAMLKNVRKHRASSGGKLPPKAKSPLAYVGAHA